MLIIFDLDDTLIDTTGSLSSGKMAEAFALMIEAGMQLPCPVAALQLLHRLDERAPSGRDALKEFATLHDLGDELLRVGLNAYARRSGDLPVFPQEGALELLERLAPLHKLALVTVGDESWQREKLEKAGIHCSYFSKIAVCAEGEKGFHYQQLLEEHGLSPREVLVCGDRIAADLTPAKELGMQTAQLLKGRGLVAPGRREDVDFFLHRLSEVGELV